MKIEKETIFVLAFPLFYFALLLWQSGNYLVTWDEGGHLTAGVFVHEGIKNFLGTFSVGETVDHLKGLSERCGCFIVLHYPPMFYFLEGVSFGIFGVGEFAGRLLAMLFSVGTLVLTYKLGKLLYDSRVGLAAAVLLAASPLFFKYSMMVMMDVGIVFFLLLLTYAYFGMTKGKIGPLSFGILWGLAFLYRYEAIFVLPVFVAHAITKERRILKSLALSFVLAVLIVSPWAAATLLRPSSAEGNSELSWWFSIMFNRYHGQGSRGLDPAYFVKLLPVQMSFPVAILGGAGVLYWLFWKGRKKTESEKEIGLVLLALAATVYLFFSLTPVRMYRYTLPILPIVAIFGAGLLVSLSERLKKMWWVGPAALAVLALTSAVQYEANLYALDAPFSNYEYGVPQVEEAARYLVENSGAGDFVMMSMIRYEVGPSTIPFYMLKYDPSFKNRFRSIQAYGMKDAGLESVEEFRKKTNSDCPKYVVVLEPHKSNEGFESLYRITAPFARLFAESGNFALAGRFDNTVADILVYGKIKSREGCI